MGKIIISYLADKKEDSFSTLKRDVEKKKKVKLLKPEKAENRNSSECAEQIYYPVGENPTFGTEPYIQSGNRL